MEVILLEGTGQKNEFTARFRSATAQELIDSYNNQVGSNAWVSAKGRFLHALYHEFKHRQIDISFIDTGAGMRLDQRITLDASGRCVVPVTTL